MYVLLTHVLLKQALDRIARIDSTAETGIEIEVVLSFVI
jgi:hypothetical protein